MFQLNTPVRGSSAQSVAVNVKKLIYIDRARGGSGNWSPQKDLKSRYGVSASTQLVINFCSADMYVDYIWEDLDRSILEIAKFDADFVFGPNFSVYRNYPSFDSHLNLKRRFVALERLQAAGVRVVPSVVWTEYSQRERVLDWLEANAVSAILRNFQTVSSTTETEQWRTMLDDLLHVRERFPSMRLFLAGCSSEARIRTIVGSVGGPITFVDARAQRLAEYHKDATGREDRSVSVSDLFERSVRVVTGWSNGG